MRFLPALIRTGVACTTFLAFPTLAIAQHSLSGRLVEQFPGGGAISNPGVDVYRVIAGAPSPSFVMGIDACLGPVTTNCVDDTGRFTIPNLSAATYLLRIRASGMLAKVQNAIVAASTNLGDIQLIRSPFIMEVIVGNIPASGGSIPVSLRARTTWTVPALPIVVRIQPFHETTFGNVAVSLTPTLLNFTWPAGLADTNVVPIATLNVSPGAIAGGAHCVTVEIWLQGNPIIPLGFSEGCAQKEP